MWRSACLTALAGPKGFDSVCREGSDTNSETPTNRSHLRGDTNWGAKPQIARSSEQALYSGGMRRGKLVERWCDRIHAILATTKSAWNFELIRHTFVSRQRTLNPGEVAYARL